MINTVQNILNQILFDHPPSSILCIGGNVATALNHFIATHPKCRVCEISLSQIDGQSPDLSSRINRPDSKITFDFSIVADVIEHMNKNAAVQLLARLRDLYTKKLLVVVPIGNEWTGHQSLWRDSDFLALGFVGKARIQVAKKPIHVYAFDIATYKTTPDWLNNKYWANPQLWDKFRW
jgi:hypothetical protein